MTGGEAGQTEERTVRNGSGNHAEVGEVLVRG
jgi:hypothetical protein